MEDGDLTRNIWRFDTAKQRYIDSDCESSPFKITYTLSGLEDGPKRRQLESIPVFKNTVLPETFCIIYFYREFYSTNQLFRHVSESFLTSYFSLQKCPCEVFSLIEV